MNQELFKRVQSVNHQFWSVFLFISTIFTWKHMCGSEYSWMCNNYIPSSVLFCLQPQPRLQLVEGYAWKKCFKMSDIIHLRLTKVTNLHLHFCLKRGNLQHTPCHRSTDYNVFNTKWWIYHCNNQYIYNKTYLFKPLHSFWINKFHRCCSAHDHCLLNKFKKLIEKLKVLVGWAWALFRYTRIKPKWKMMVYNIKFT